MVKQAQSIVFVAILLAASAAMGAAPVSNAGERQERNAAESAPPVPDLAEQVQALQEEVQTLRGMVEVNEHQMSQLNDRLRDLYSDLDSRINELKNPPASSSSSPEVKPEASSAEKTLYNSAYDLMQEKQYDAAITAFNQYIKTYPNGRYVPNAYYWVGETQLIGKDLDAAKMAFQNIVNQFPTHQKSADALLKLGYVYDAAGQKDKALKTLNQVIQKYPGSSVARIAEQRVQNIKQKS